MSGSDLSTLESCLLLSDAPESVWRPALHSLRMELEQAHLDNISAFDLLSRVRMALGDNGKRMQDELIEHCKGLAKAESQLSQAREALERIAALEHASEESPRVTWVDTWDIARAALAAMKGEAK